MVEAEAAIDEVIGMAELGHNYNIQCMKLFQELKTAFPSVPDDVVRHCMKKVILPLNIPSFMMSILAILTKSEIGH